MNIKCGIIHAAMNKTFSKISLTVKDWPSYCLHFQTNDRWLQQNRKDYYKSTKVEVYLSVASLSSTVLIAPPQSASLSILSSALQAWNSLIRALLGISVFICSSFVPHTLVSVLRSTMVFWSFCTASNPPGSSPVCNPLCQSQHFTRDSVTVMITHGCK